MLHGDLLPITAAEQREWMNELMHVYVSALVELSIYGQLLYSSLCEQHEW